MNVVLKRRKAAIFLLPEQVILPRPRPRRSEFYSIDSESFVWVYLHSCKKCKKSICKKHTCLHLDALCKQHLYRNRIKIATSKPIVCAISFHNAPNDWCLVAHQNKISFIFFLKKNAFTFASKSSRLFRGVSSLTSKVTKLT